MKLVSYIPVTQTSGVAVWQIDEQIRYYPARLSWGRWSYLIGDSGELWYVSEAGARLALGDFRGANRTARVGPDTEKVPAIVPTL